MSFSMLSKILTAMVVLNCSGCIAHVTAAIDGRDGINEEKYENLTSQKGIFLLSGEPKLEAQQEINAGLSSIQRPTELFDKSARKVYSLYCQNGRQTRAIRAHISTLIPPPPIGVAVDIAAEIVAKRTEETRHIVRKFFDLGSRPFKPKTEKPSCANREISLLPSIEKKSLQDLVQNIPNDAENYQRSFVAIEGLGNQFLLLPWPKPGNRVGLMDVRGIYVQDWDACSLDSGVGESVNGVHHPDLLIASNKPLRIKIYDNGIPEWAIGYSPGHLPYIWGFWVGGENRTAYPLAPASLIEFLLLRNAYTLLIPSEVQDGIQNTNRNWQKIGVDHDGRIAVSKAIEDRDMLWEQFLSTFASVQEAPGKDSQSINFEVTMDLSLLCRYGRPATDLLSN